MYRRDDGKKWREKVAATPLPSPPRGGMNGHNRPPARKKKPTLKRVIAIARPYLKYVSIPLACIFGARAETNARIC